MVRNLLSALILIMPISCCSLQCRMHINQGNCCFQLGEWQNAIQEYNQAINLNADDFKVYHSRGLTYKILGDYGHAIEDFSQAIQIRPTYEMAYYHRAKVHLILGEYEQAITDFQKAVDLNPNRNFIDELDSANAKFRRLKKR